jgi:hypothetical protein
VAESEVSLSEEQEEFVELCEKVEDCLEGVSLNQVMQVFAAVLCDLIEEASGSKEEKDYNHTQFLEHLQRFRAE